MAEDHFKKLIVDTIAKRAGHRCSNPDCGAQTIGPATDALGLVNVGEAAHIFGALPRSARYDAAMSPADRSDITNAIWLCCTCHKKADDDEGRYSADLLFEWKRSHEHQISAAIGKTSADIRKKLSDRLLSDMPGIGYLAEQIVLDRPDHWEYKLTSGILRHALTPITRRWAQLQEGLYGKRIEQIRLEDVVEWIGSKFSELQHQARAFDKIINEQIPLSWGPDGKSGDAHSIYISCILLREACERALDWEEQVRFSKVPASFEPVQAVILGIGGHLIEETATLPQKMQAIFDQQNPSGTHRISLTFLPPDDFNERFEDAMADATRDAFGFESRSR